MGGFGGQMDVLAECSDTLHCAPNKKDAFLASSISILTSLVTVTDAKGGSTKRLKRVSAQRQSQFLLAADWPRHAGHVWAGFQSRPRPLLLFVLLYSSHPLASVDFTVLCFRLYAVRC